MTRLQRFLLLGAAIAVLGAGSAAAATLITGKDVQNKSLTGTDLALRTLAVKHLTPPARAKLRGAEGPQGERGPSTAFAFHVKEGQPIVGQGSRLVASLDVPKGAYVLTAKTVIANTGAVTAVPDCLLGVGAGPAFTEADQIDGVKLTPVGSDSDTAAFNLSGTATVGAQTPVELRCTPGTGQTIIARDRTLIATQVGELK